ncbi:5-methylcytosine-specific restriction endonuclease system specificity protein McrC [Candidatus Latescibacterota bacterium]
MAVSPAPSAQEDRAAEGRIGVIPVRNLWLLMLYASDLFRQGALGHVAVEAPPDEIPDLVAEFLARAVERRIRRNLSYGYVERAEILSRLRGRVDTLRTVRHQLLRRGKVACRFQDLTVDTARNQLVRSALGVAARCVGRPDVGSRCRGLSGALGAMGVSATLPDSTALRADQIGRHQVADRSMVAAAELLLRLRLPTEQGGTASLARPDREAKWVRKLFERAVGGLYDVALSPLGWRVSAGRHQQWRVEGKTLGIDAILPTMKTDIILECPDPLHRIVIDTKFTSLLTKGWYREQSVRSGYVYQMYAYLRSQEGREDPLADGASGILLHPSVSQTIDETVVIQGHALRFATVDLAAESGAIRERLMEIAWGATRSDAPREPIAGDASDV